MADVFISYARPDRELAKALAEELVARGYSVWWDAELVGTDKFRDVIWAELSQAKAAIVIWSKNSVCSEFVRDEAGRAQKSNRLIATHQPGFDIATIPLGFGERHSHNVREIEQTLKALSKLGVGAVAERGNKAPEVIQSAKNSPSDTTPPKLKLRKQKLKKVSLGRDEACHRRSIAGQKLPVI